MSNVVPFPHLRQSIPLETDADILWLFGALRVSVADTLTNNDSNDEARATVLDWTVGRFIRALAAREEYASRVQWFNNEDNSNDL